MALVPNCGGFSLNRGKSYQKLFIRPYDGGGWKEFSGVVKDAITIEQRLPDKIEVSNSGSIKLTFTVKVKKLRKAIMRLIGKPRKTTFKTLRHDCAKRNERR